MRVEAAEILEKPASGAAIAGVAGEFGQPDQVRAGQRTEVLAGAQTFACDVECLAGVPQGQQLRHEFLGQAMRKAGVKPSRGGRGQDLEGIVPPEVQWKAHNYMHLTEQPTIFYAIVFALILMGFDAPINVYLAWGYVGLRIVHSIVQATVNVVRIRFLIFLLATVCLVGLTTHAALELIHHA